MKQRILVLLAAAALMLVLAACGKADADGKKIIKIGYQKGGTTLTVKGQKKLEKDLKKQGYSVVWSEFNTASSSLEALNAGSIDLANGGDAPSIMALSKGMDFVYIASEPSAPNTEGILVGKDSGIDSIEKLKGKRIAFNKASISEYLLTQVLASKGLTMKDVEPVYLNPPDASVAFEKGDVDAWVVWDPYMTVSESKGNVVLQDAGDIVPYRSFYFSTSELAEKHPEVIETYVSYLTEAGQSIDKDPTKAAELMQKETNIKADIWKKVLNKKESNVQFIDDEAVNDMQAEADDLKKIGLISETVHIKEHVWIKK